ncbi:MAG: hypothetical protein ACPG6R_11155 [Aequoribacter sp.]
MLHADETPVNMLELGNKKTKKACVWAYFSHVSVSRCRKWEFLNGC